MAHPELHRATGRRVGRVSPCRSAYRRFNGSTSDCPGDGAAPAGTACRAAAGACDVAESCDGASAACPANGFLPAGTACRPAADSCDAAETCSGVDAVCPAGTGAPDGDGDGACDPQDVCLTTPDPTQADGDGDGVGDACDPCTTGAAAGMTSRTLRVAGLKPPAGNETLAFTGTIVVPTTPEIDPAAGGVRLLIAAATGESFVDVTIPGGPGWKTNRARTKWSHRGASGGRIREVVLQRSRSAPGKIRFRRYRPGQLRSARH